MAHFSLQHLYFAPLFLLTSCQLLTWRIRLTLALLHRHLLTTVVWPNVQIHNALECLCRWFVYILLITVLINVSYLNFSCWCFELHCLLYSTCIIMCLNMFYLLLVSELFANHSIGWKQMLYSRVLWCTVCLCMSCRLNTMFVVNEQIIIFVLQSKTVEYFNYQLYCCWCLNYCWCLFILIHVYFVTRKWSELNANYVPNTNTYLIWCYLYVLFVIDSIYWTQIKRYVFIIKIIIMWHILHNASNVVNYVTYDFMETVRFKIITQCHICHQLFKKIDCFCHLNKLFAICFNCNFIFYQKKAMFINSTNRYTLF